MTSRGAAAVLNAVLWGSGYMYSKRGASGILAVFADLALYFWLFELGSEGLIVLGPILLLGALYFGIDGYRYAIPVRQETTAKDRPTKRMSTCSECGASISPNAKFCSECGARQGRSKEP